MHNNKHKLWVEKYRPHDLGSYIFHDATHRAIIQRMVEEKTIPHLLLAGVQGIGKTSLAKIAMEIDPSDVLELNASDTRGIDTFRDVIKNFATTMSMGTFKIIHLEEAKNFSEIADLLSSERR